MYKFLRAMLSFPLGTSQGVELLGKAVTLFLEELPG